MEPLPCITVSDIDALRAAIAQKLSGKRLAHTLGVEKEIARLGELYLPQDILRLRVSALLHDITKEKTAEAQIALCQELSIPLTDEDRLSPKILHAWTAAEMIKRDFPMFADPDILLAIKQHTTGARGMPLFSKLLYLADYIEETRTFSDCVALRNAFWTPVPTLKQEAYVSHLNQILLIAFDKTIASLLEENAIISLSTVDARNALIEEISTHN